LHLDAGAGIEGPLILNFTMADREDKNVENVPGKFYVDSQCIDCDLCRETAPNNFTRAEDEGYSYVFKQPESAEDLAQCREAMEGCPVEAIGEDGAE
jgi:ferredoxin